MHLGKAGGPEPVQPAAEIDQQQPGFTAAALQLRRQRTPDVFHRREGGHDQGNRCDYALLTT